MAAMQKTTLNIKRALLHTFLSSDGMNEITTAFSSYQDPNQLRMEVNPLAIDRLKKTSIHAPLGNSREFTTEHLDQYIPKHSGKVMVDSGKLQRSTVPLGTMKI